MTIYKDVNGREFTYNEYSKKVYLDEKRPHVDHLIRHKWPDEKPEKPGKYLVRVEYEDDGAIVHETTTDEWNGFTWYEHIEDYITHWWNLPEVGNE